MIIFMILAVLHMVSMNRAILINSNPLQGEAFTQTKSWEVFNPSGPLSASVADFYNDVKGCRRLVVFNAQGHSLATIRQACHSSDLHLGLVFKDDALWYYGVAFIKRDPSASTGQSTYTVVNLQSQKGTCKKSVFVIKDDDSQPATQYLGKRVHSDGARADVDCHSLVNPPVMVISHDHSEEFSEDAFGSPVIFNAMGLVVQLKMHENRLACFQLVEFFSGDHLVASLIMSCGPLQGIVLSDGVFYYGHTLMMKPARDPSNEDKTFNLYINTFDKRSTPKPSTKLHHAMFKNKNTPSKCLVKTININGNGERTESVSEVTSKTVDHTIFQECTDFVDGHLEVITADEDDVNNLITSMANNQPRVDRNTLDELKGYSLVEWTDVNLATTLGLMVLSYMKDGSSQSEDMRRLIVVVSKGVALAHVLVQPRKELEEIIFPKNEVVFHDYDLVAWEDSVGDIQVVAKDGHDSCIQHTYRVLVTESGRKNTKKSYGTKYLSPKLDSTCQSLFQD